MKYKMYYVSGAGIKYDGGEWQLTKTAKTTTFTVITKPFFALCCPPTMRIRHAKERSHCLRDWGDGTYTVYPFQFGTPHVFKPL